MIILAPGALDRVFSAETAQRAAAPVHDSRFAQWLATTPSDTAIANHNAPTTPYRNRATRFE